MALGS